MSDQLTFWDTAASTSSPAQERGSTPCGSPVSTDHAGPAPVPASLSVPPASTRGPPTPGTSGPKCSGLSESADPVSSSVNRWLQRMDSAGSMEYSLTLRERVTPAGRRIPALRASVRRTSDSGCSGWPTSRAEDAECSGARLTRGTADTLTEVSRLTGWPTARAGDAKGAANETANRSPDAKGYHKGLTLVDASILTGWPSPQGMSHGPDSNRPGQERLGAFVRSLTGWTSPQRHDGAGGKEHRDKKDARGSGGVCLQTQAAIAGWASPTSRDWKDTAGMATESVNPDGSVRKRTDLLPRQVIGTASPSFPAETGNRGALNPALSLWLMGWPSDWLMVAPVRTRRGRRSSASSATASSLKSPPDSSEP